MIDKNELLKLSELSKLYINDNETDTYLKELNEMLDFLKNMGDDGVSDIKVRTFCDLREDNVIKSYDFETVSKNTKNKNDNYFYLSEGESIWHLL